MMIFFVADVFVTGADGGSASAVREHARSRLEDVTVDALDLLAVAPRCESQENFLGEILSIAAQLRRTARKETIQRAAIAHCQCLNKRLLAPRYAGNGRPAVPPIACHSSSPLHARDWASPLAESTVAVGEKVDQE
jgi:hypothetical protein